MVTIQDSIIFLEETKKYLMGKRRFLLALLENPNLLEHETFTDSLRAVFHLTEELEKEKILNIYPKQIMIILNLILKGLITY